MTKPITGVALMVLVDKGIVSLHDDVKKWIPSFDNLSVVTGGTADESITEPLKEPMKIWHLLTHTSGISYAFFGNNLSDQILRKNIGPDFQNWFHFTDLEVLCEGIAKTPLCFHPGTHFHYGLSTDVVGRIIEVASGLKLDEFFQKEIFTPLGMKNTYFQVPADQLHRLVECMEIGPAHSYYPSKNPERERAAKPVLLAGGGSLVSSIGDYAKFSTMMVNKGQYNGVRIVSEDSFAQMTQNWLPNNAQIADMSFEKGFSESLGPGIGFGLTVAVVVDPLAVRGGKFTSLGEFSWGGVAGTAWRADPIHKHTTLLMTQVIGCGSAYPIRGQLRYLVNTALHEK